MRRFLDKAFKIVFSRTLIILLMVLLQILVLFVSFHWLGRYFSFIWEGMSFLGAILIIYIINKDEPTEFKLTWIIPICLFPVMGALLYLFVSTNLGGLGLKAQLHAQAERTRGLLSTSPKTQEAVEAQEAYFRGFAHYMEETAGFPVYHHSDAVYYPQGEDKFQALLTELKKAERFIFMEYFIVERGSMWDAVLEILKEKARAGVEVRLMYDGMCSLLLLPYRYPKELARYGIHAKMFAPIIPFLSTTQNNRDHRKIVVIDGKVAFTGGVNLADEYINQKVRFGHWKDTAVKVTGDAVRSFTVLFLQMWNVSEKGQEDYGKYLGGADLKELPQPNGFVIPYGDMPTGKTEVAKTVYESMINNATRYVHIMTPYFIVDREFLDVMRFAAQRGVEVVMILPHIPDKKAVYYVARNFYPELLAAGIKVYEYTPGFIHAKAFAADDNSAVVGTVNLDYRSFYHHFECGAYFYGSSVVRQVEEDFRQTLMKCQEVTMEYYNKEVPLYQKLLGSMIHLFAPLL